jgi:hypothetical protein
MIAGRNGGCVIGGTTEFNVTGRGDMVANSRFIFIYLIFFTFRCGITKINLHLPCLYKIKLKER